MQIAGAKDGRKDGEEKKEVRKGVGERRNGEKGGDNKTDRSKKKRKEEWQGGEAEWRRTGQTTEEWREEIKRKEGGRGAENFIRSGRQRGQRKGGKVREVDWRERKESSFFT